jgi:hypothetical protein
MKYIVALLILTFAAGNALAQEDPISIPLRTWKNEEERIEEQQQIRRWKNNWDEYISHKQKVALNLGKSALLPGMGQFSCKREGKGAIFLGSTIATSGGAVYFLLKSNEKYEKYKEADNIEDIEKYFDESEDLSKYSNICFGIGAAIWAINIIDAYFSTISYNEKQFEEFYYGFREKKLVPNVHLSMRREEVSVSLAYRF